MHRHFIIAGGSMMLFSLAGKSFIYFYRTLKAQEKVLRSAQLGKFYKGGFLGKMNTSEASKILGVRESSDQQKIIATHRKLMFLNHPDNGGSTYLATKVNEAKEVLLKGR